MKMIKKFMSFYASSFKEAARELNLPAYY